MLQPRSYAAFCLFLNFGCSFKFFPHEWDAKERRLKKGGARQWFYFSLHRTVIATMLSFSAFRLSQAMATPQFPLLLKVLNIAWVGGYSLAIVGFHQWDINEEYIRQFGNWVLIYADPNRNQNMRRVVDKEVKKEERNIGLHLIFGLILFLGNPGVHMTLVHETPCAPHFTSSLAFECPGWKAEGVGFFAKLPFIVIEYYLILTMFIAITFNWAVIYLGLSWLKREINAFRRRLIKNNETPGVFPFREVEVVASLMNDAFAPYLAAFPSLLFFMVSTLIFGVVRLLHVAPLANIMFPVCAIECLFDAVTPLAVAGDINFQNKNLQAIWKKFLANPHKSLSTKEDRRLLTAYRKACNGVRVTSGHFFTFENTIVLVCLHNCIQLTLNMLVSFKGQ